MDRKFIDCRDYPSDSGCSIAISADSEDEVVEAAAQHAVKVHGHEDAGSGRDRVGDGSRVDCEGSRVDVGEAGDGAALENGIQGCDEREW